MQNEQCLEHLVSLDDSILMHIDWQTKLMPFLLEGEKAFKHAVVLGRIAKTLNVPTFTTVHWPEKIGPLHDDLLPVSGDQIYKQTFNCALCPEVMEYLKASGKKTVVVTGIEASICVLQTLLSLQSMGFRCVLVVDAIAARKTLDLELALKRLRQHGVVIATVDMVTYEWLQTPSHLAFKAVLQEIKALAA